MYDTFLFFLQKTHHRDTKEMVQSSQSEIGPPAVFPNWAVNPSHHPCEAPAPSTVLPADHEDSSTGTNSDCSSD